MSLGFDCGTYNLVSCRRSKNGDFEHKREVNAFMEMPLENKFIFNMMKQAGVPLIEKEDEKVAYALGEAAVNIAYSMNQVTLRRPMMHGCLNPKEKNAQQIMSIMIHSLIENCSKDEVLYYSVPSNAINEETDADYHSKVLEAIFKSFEDDEGNSLSAFPINEALALLYAESSDTSYTGIGISFGSGMVNLCFSIFGAPVFQFSIVNSGDWIDKMAAKATGETIAYINQEKTKLNLKEKTDSLVMNAIKAQYEIMIQKTVSQIKQGLENAGKKARTGNPIKIVIAGGTSSPNGFETLFENTIRDSALPIEIGEIVKPKNPLFSVAEGCLIAAENHY